MSDTNEKRCKKCGKIIPSYVKIPICKRCRLEARNIGGEGGGIALLAIAAIKKISDDKK